MNQLVLSLFPGIGLLDMAFEEEGFCVVRGPDLLWGGNIERFWPPTRRFDGIIGGPPCQDKSVMRHLALSGNGTKSGVHGDKVPEFVRVVEYCSPQWFLMENVRDCYTPQVTSFEVYESYINNRWFGQDQNRPRKFWFGRNLYYGSVPRCNPFLKLKFETFDSISFEPAVLAGHGPAASQRDRGIKNRTPAEMCKLQGLPENFTDEMPFTVHGKKKVIGNGVPLPMGRAIAKAIRAQLESVK